MSSALRPMRTLMLTTLAMLAFAANSLLCRAALLETEIDPASFTTLRVIAGALMLGFIVLIRHRRDKPLLFSSGSWFSASALFIYAAAFSFAYVSLSTATGALILFAAVQVTMIGWGFWRGERLQNLQWLGVFFAFAGLIGLLLPGLSAPPFSAAVLMLIAGIAWGVYSLRGAGQGDATQVTAGNFMRAIPFAVILSLAFFSRLQLDGVGVVYAMTSGALASGAGYAIWYAVLPILRATSAATIQLSVPVIASLAGVLFLDEPLTPRIMLSSLTILGGVALVINFKSTTST